MTSDSWTPVHHYGQERSAPIVLVCEHASFLFPKEFRSLGLDSKTLKSHAAGDIGALAVAKGLSDALDAPLVYGGISRLVYDCNRPLESAGAIPIKSEIYDIPGNVGLSAAQKKARFDTIHEPFHQTVANLIEAQQGKAEQPVSVITIHSFTPVYLGIRRAVEIGFLHDKNSTLSELALEAEHRQGAYVANLNQPYDASDGVTYTLQKHAEKKQLDSTMIEISSELINTDTKAKNMAAHLAKTLTVAFSSLHAKRDIT